MEPIISRCGYRCDLCLAYRPNIETHPDNQKVLSDGWFQYFGFRIEPEDIRCDGCITQNSKLIDKNCPVRPCVIQRDFENCSQCEEYICENLKQRLVDFKEIQERLGKEIPKDDRLKFIHPYENTQRLEEIRNKK
jgi:hypothetical protein